MTKFTLVTPQVGIDGIRLIGENGGLAGGDTNGFLGVFDLKVTVATSPIVFTGIRHLSPPADSVHLTWLSKLGVDYSLFYSLDLIDFSNAVSSTISSGGTTTEFSFPSPVPNASQMFFRAVENP